MDLILLPLDQDGAMAFEDPPGEWLKKEDGDEGRKGSVCSRGVAPLVCNGPRRCLILIAPLHQVPNIGLTRRQIIRVGICPHPALGSVSKL